MIPLCILLHSECLNITSIPYLHSLCLAENFYSISGHRKFTCVLCSLCLIKKRKLQQWIERLMVALRLYAWICLLWSRNFLFIYYYFWALCSFIYQWSALQQILGYMYFSFLRTRFWRQFMRHSFGNMYYICEDDLKVHWICLVTVYIPAFFLIFLVTLVISWGKKYRS